MMEQRWFLRSSPLGPRWHRALRSLLVIVIVGLMVLPAQAANPPLAFHQIVGVNLLTTNTNGFHSLSAGALFYFTATDSAHGTELWVTDGTQAGTHLVKDLNPGVTSTDLVFLDAVGTRAYFAWVKVASPGGNQVMLAITDGSQNGTVDLRDLGGADTTALPDTVPHVVAGGKLYLVLDSILWVSAGTPASTLQLTSASSGYVTNLVGSSSRAFFVLAQLSGGSTNVWTTDGTPGGTRSLVSTCVGPAGLGALDNSVYFSKLKDCQSSDTDPGVWELWTVNGVSGEPKNLYTFPQNIIDGIVYPERIYGFTPANGNLFFFSESDHPQPDVHGQFDYSVWGVNGATQAVSNLGGYEWDGRTSLRGFTTPVVGGSVLYYGSYPYRVWGPAWLDRTDGASSFRVFTTAAPPAGATVMPPAVVRAYNNGSVLFLSDGPYDAQVLYYNNGTPGGTIALKTLSTEAHENPLEGWLGGADFDGSFYFIYYFNDTWLFMRTNGTPAGTQPVDFPAAPTYYSILGSTPLGLFVERFGDTNELWSLSYQQYSLYLPLVRR